LAGYRPAWRETGEIPGGGEVPGDKEPSLVSSDLPGERLGRFLEEGEVPGDKEPSLVSWGVITFSA